MDNVNQLLRNLPKVDEVLKKFDSCYDRDLLKYVINSILDGYRQKIRNGILKYVDIDKIIEDIKISYNQFVRGSLIKVVNATGIPIHTNLGRSPILYDVYEMSKDIICGYSNLEFDLEEGSRGDRYFHCDQYLRYLTGAESSLVVNNNAAAVFLILNSFAKDREVVVSRGELIEIGGSFRLPDVMTASGAILREVGTTNKTKLSDYHNAINDKTSIIMKSHTSNYKIIGFTESVSLEEIAKLSAQNNLISYYDAGSGAMIDFNFGNCFEKSVKNVVEKGIDLVSFSGDKLLGGPQAGIIVGKKVLIDRLKKNPMLRMLRVDKTTISFLQFTLLKYIIANKDNPLQRFFTSDIEYLKSKSLKLQDLLNNNISELSFKSTKLKSFTGGGACPMMEIDSYGVVVYLGESKSEKISTRLRNYDCPIICRIESGEIIFDVRTIDEDEFEIISKGMKWALRD